MAESFPRVSNTKADLSITMPDGTFLLEKKKKSLD
jgi:hypothetical protein